MTSGFSKKVENHAHSIALFAMYYNFVRAHGKPLNRELKMIDRSSKIILIVIAAGLWANIAAPIFRPTVAMADQMEMYVAAIYNGTCVNHKIC